MSNNIVVFNGKKYYFHKSTGYFRDYKGNYLHYAIKPRIKGLTIDHKDRDKTNNDLSNLRYATYAQNSVNVPPRGKVKYKLVSFYEGPPYRKRPYRTAVTIGKNSFCFGWFETAEEAAYVADQVMLQLHGEFSCTNFRWE